MFNWSPVAGIQVARPWSPGGHRIADVEAVSGFEAIIGKGYINAKHVYGTTDIIDSIFNTFPRQIRYTEAGGRLALFVKTVAL